MTEARIEEAGLAIDDRLDGRLVGAWRRGRDALVGVRVRVRLAMRRARHRAKGLEPSPVRPMSTEERAAAEEFIAREEKALAAGVLP